MSSTTDENRGRYSVKKYTFSGKIKCGFCDAGFTMKVNNSLSLNPVNVWWCLTASKKGLSNCRDSRRIPETVIEHIFVEMFNKIKGYGEDNEKEFYERLEESLKKETSFDEIQKMKYQVNKYDSDIEKLTKMRLNNEIDIDVFERLYNEFKKKKDFVEYKLNEKTNIRSLQLEIKERMNSFKETIDSSEKLNEFNADLFDTLVEKVIIGGYDKSGKPDSYKVTIVLKGGTKAYDKNQEPIMTFVSDATFFAFIVTNEGRKKVLVSDIDVSVAFSNESENVVTPEVIQKKILFEHKEFMGNKSGNEISRELGIAGSVITTYKRKIIDK